MKSDNNKRLQVWIGIAVSLLCLVAIFLVIEPAEILAALTAADYRYVALSFLGIVLFLVIRAVRWRFMLGNRVPYGQVFHIQNIGYLLTFILPLRLGDVGRAVLIGNVPPVTLPQGLSTMVVERVLDLLFIVTLLPLTIVAVPAVPENLQNAAQAAGLLGLLAMVVLVLAANQRALAGRIAIAILDRIPFLNTAAWVRRLDELLAGLSSLTTLRDALILVVLSIVVWLPILFAYYAGLRSVHLEPTLAMAGFVVCAAAFSVAAPSSPGQVGVFHAGVIFALVEILRQPEGPAASFAFIYHALNFLASLSLGLIGVWRIGATLGNIIANTRNMMNRNRQPAGS